MENQIIQGTIAILFLIFIREFFSYLKSRKNDKINDIQSERNGILGELKLINENHLRCIEKAIRDGDDRIVDAINNGNQKIIDSLGEIKGRLEK